MTVLSLDTGWAGGCAGAAAGSAAWWLVDRLQRRPSASRDSVDAGLPLSLDLAAAALRSGRTVADALAAGAPACDGCAATMARVVGALRAGDDPASAWAAALADPRLHLVARVAVRSAGSGARLADAFERTAAQLRREAAAQATTRAQRAGVLAVLPVGLCHLPAFVCLGVIPVLAGVARAAIAGR